MKLALVVRPDHEVKPGGDIVQASAYGRWLRAQGHEVVLGPIGPATDGCELAMIFNIDLMSEWVRAGDALAERGCPYVAVPVHHPWEWLGRFERAGRSGPLHWANWVLRTPGLRDRVRDVARSGAGSRARWHARHPRSLVAQAAAVLAGAADVVYLAEGERTHIERDFGVSPAGTVVRNGVHEDTPLPIVERDVDVAVVGRIEERKNQLHLARALVGSGLTVVFAGHVSRSNRRYAAALEEVISADDRLRYVGQLPREEMARTLARTKVSASTSWVEVLSLVDVEAHVAGAAVVASSRGFSRSYGIAGMLELGPESSSEDVLQTCRRAVAGWQEPSLAERERRLDEHSWRITLAPLEGIVQRHAR